MEVREGELLAEEPQEELSCQACSFTTPFFHLLLPHLALHSDMGAKKPSTRTSPSHRLECSQCGKLFKKPEVLEAHMKKEHHGNTTPWECSLCGKGFTRKASLEEHMARHQGRKQRHCVPCDKYFYDTVTRSPALFVANCPPPARHSGDTRPPCTLRRSDCGSPAPTVTGSSHRGSRWSSTARVT